MRASLTRRSKSDALARPDVIVCVAARTDGPGRRSVWVAQCAAQRGHTPKVKYNKKKEKIKTFKPKTYFIKHMPYFVEIYTYAYGKIYTYALLWANLNYKRKPSIWL
jgi:hypothetical protein